MRIKYATPVAILTSGGLIGYGLLRSGSPSDWLWQFFYNMKNPLSLVWCVVAAIAFWVIYGSVREMQNIPKESYDYSVYDFRVWTSVNITLVLTILWLFVMSVPEPTFRKETKWMVQTRTKIVRQNVPGPTVYKMGQRVVYHSPTYVEAYELCIKNYNGSYDRELGGPTSRCHAQAMQASAPPGKFKYLTRTTTYRDPYEVLFKLCMDSAGDTYSSTIQTCRDFALKQPPPQEKK
jgi:hypothetical protein